MKKTNKKHPDIGKWAITYVTPPYPTNIGKIINVYFDKNGEARVYELQFGYGREVWVKRNCKIFNTEKEAQKEYVSFRNNKNNYAYEG